MSGLSNAFSILNLDAEDDKEQIATISFAMDEEKAKKNGGVSVNPKKDKLEQGMAESFLGKFSKPLVWIDLEMTGLNVEVDRILEVACIVTDVKFAIATQKVEKEHSRYIWVQIWLLASQGSAWITWANGVMSIMELVVVEFIEKHIGSDTALLAGNSVYMDLLFLKKYMPRLAALFPHVLVDVSSIMVLCIHWFPVERKKAPTKEKNHRAMDDIRECIRELKYYKESIFKGPGKFKR